MPQWKIGENPDIDYGIERCVNVQHSIPDAFNVSIARVNNHIIINVGHKGKYDFYEIGPNSFEVCQDAKLGLTAPIFTTTEDAIKQCEK